VFPLKSGSRWPCNCLVPSFSGRLLPESRAGATRSSTGKSSAVCNRRPSLRNFANLPNSARAACGTSVCRLQDENGHCARFLGVLPTDGALGRTYPLGGYPFADADQAATWRVPLDEWLVELGRYLYERVPFRLALLGFEVDFRNVSADFVQRNGIPAERLTVIGGRQEINWSGILRPIGISFASLAKIRRRDKVRRPSPPGGHDQLLIGARARIET